MRLIFIFAATLLTINAATAAAQIFPSSAGNLNVETVAGGLVHPWALAFLPDGRMLVTERPGRMRIVTRDGKLSGRLPACRTSSHQGQGGLHRRRAGRATSRQRTRSISATPIAATRRRADRGGARALQEDTRSIRLATVKHHLPPARPGLGGNNIGCRIVQAPTAICSSRSAIISPPPSWRRRSTITSARSSASRPTARCRPTIRSSASQGAQPEIWAYGLATPRGALSIPTAANCGSRARPRAATRSTSSARARITAGRGGYGLNYNGAPVDDGKAQAPAWPTRSGIGRRRSRHPAWRFIPAICFRPGRATCSSAH